jgi:hypothetical protein
MTKTVTAVAAVTTFVLDYRKVVEFLEAAKVGCVSLPGDVEVFFPVPQGSDRNPDMCWKESGKDAWLGEYEIILRPYGGRKVGSVTIEELRLLEITDLTFDGATPEGIAKHRLATFQIDWEYSRMDDEVRD